MLTIYNNRLKKVITSEKSMQKIYGKMNKDKILLRIAQIEQAMNLKCLTNGRPHVLGGDRLGYVAIDIQHPYRLICKPISYLTDILDARVLQICEIVDYH